MTLDEFLSQYLPKESIQGLKLVYDFYPLEIEGNVIMVCGISVNATGVYHLFMMCIDELFKNYRISAVRHLRYVDSMLKNHYKAKRVELDIKADSDVDRNFAEFFGFHEESLMPMFGPNNETYAKYVRLTNG